MPISCIPALPQLITNVAAADSSPSETNVSKGNQAGTLCVKESEASAIAGVEMPPSFFSQVLSSSVEAIGQSSIGSGVSSAIDGNIDPAVQPNQKGEILVQKLRHIGFGLVLGNELPAVTSPRKSVCLKQEKGSSDKPELKQSAQGASSGERSAFDARFVPAWPSFSLVTSSAPVVAGSNARGSATKRSEVETAPVDSPGYITSVLQLKNHDVMPPAIPGIASADRVIDPARGVATQMVGETETLAFQLQLSRDSKGLAPEANTKAASENVILIPSESRIKNSAPLDARLSSAPAVSIPASTDSLLAQTSILPPDLQAPPTKKDDVLSVYPPSVFQGMPVSKGEKPPSVVTQPSTQPAMNGVLPGQLEKVAPLLTPQILSSDDLKGNDIGQGSKFVVPVPTKETGTRASAEAPQAQIATAIGMSQAPSLSGPATEPKPLSKSPILPIEEHSSGTLPAKADLSVRIVGQSGEIVNVRVSERGGEVQVAVRTSDSAVASQIRHELPAVQAGLERIGWNAETAFGAAHSATHHNDSKSDSEAGRQNQQPSRGTSDSQSRQDRRRAPGQNAWAKFLGQD